MIQLEQFDHVAIRASDPEKSARWYRDVLGLVRLRVPEWEPYPIMMMTGDQGIAIFPLNGKTDTGAPTSGQAGFAHLAFRVDQENFARARSRFEDLEIPFTIEDHIYFKSVYVDDPDGLQIELTTPIRPIPS